MLRTRRSRDAGPWRRRSLMRSRRSAIAGRCCVIAALLDGPRRFGELQDEVEGIAPNVLTQRLRQLERNALVVARPYSERPPRFVYELSAAGHELAGALRLLAGWGARNAEGAAAPRHVGVRHADGGALVVPDVRAAGGRRRGRRAPLRLSRPRPQGEKRSSRAPARDSVPRTGRMPAMLRLIGIVISIGLADSLNPTTIGPALYLAGGERAPRPRGRVHARRCSLVYFVGGAAIALGPGQLILSARAPPAATTARHIIEIVAGAAMLVGGGAAVAPPAAARAARAAELRPGGTIERAARRDDHRDRAADRFPYFAAIAAIVGSGLGPARQLVPARAVQRVLRRCRCSVIVGVLTFARRPRGSDCSRAGRGHASAHTGRGARRARARGRRVRRRCSA